MLLTVRGWPLLLGRACGWNEYKSQGICGGQWCMKGWCSLTGRLEGSIGHFAPGRGRPIGFGDCQHAGRLRLGGLGLVT